MGLRIIGRSKPQPGRDLSEAELLAGLKAETVHWSTVRGPANLDQAEFIANFRQVKARLTTAAEMTEMATKVRDNILDRRRDPAVSHGQVDVATLLELL